MKALRYSAVRSVLGDILRPVLRCAAPRLLYKRLLFYPSCAFSKRVHNPCMQGVLGGGTGHSAKHAVCKKRVCIIVQAAACEQCRASELATRLADIVTVDRIVARVFAGGWEVYGQKPASRWRSEWLRPGLARSTHAAILPLRSAGQAHTMCQG